MDFSKLNKEQLVAATYSGKHLLVLAGAGTGKTRTIIARAIHLINNGVDPGRIKILSFTKKSAQEIVARIRIESDGNNKAKGLKGSTFHAWCMELIQRYEKAFGMGGFTCIDADDRETAFKLVMGRIFGKQTIKLKDRCRLTPGVISDIYSFAVNTRCSLSDSIYSQLNLSKGQPGQEAMAEQSREICEKVIREFIAYKQKQKYIDYDDMLMIVASSLKKNPDLRKRISSLYDHILIDEMQDTNPLQWLLLESFYDNCHLFCVGDDAQSIYAFRGADFKSIHTFKQKVPGGEVYKLTENYRSTQEILDLANWVLDKSPLKYDKHLVAHRGKGKKPVLYLLDSPWEEANVVTDIIQKGHVEGKAYRDYLILSRNAFSCRTVESACITKGIPYCLYGGTMLMKSAHVRDVVSALRIVSNYHDELAWTRYLTLWPGIGEVSAAKIVDQAMDKSEMKSAIECVGKPGIRDVLEAITGYVMNPAQAIDIVVDKMDALLNKKYDNWDIRKKDFESLKIVASKCVDIASFITEYILDPSAEQTAKVPDKENDDFTIISTIHSAKGLEADTCFVINVTPSSYPSTKAVTIDEIEEERRCLYVALTRAKNSLNIMSRKDSVSAYEDDVLDDDDEDLEEAQDGEKYFLNGLTPPLIEYSADSATPAKFDGYSSEWAEKGPSTIDLLDEFDFS